MKSRQLAVLLSLCLLLGLYIALQMYIARHKPDSQVTASSNYGTGLSIFMEFANRYYPGRVLLKRSALMTQSELAPRGALFIMSPEAEISPREAGLMRDYVASGGVILVSFHNEQSWKALRYLRQALKLKLEIEEYPDFKNREPSFAIAPPGVPLFDSGARFAFYSRLIFDAEDCHRGSFGCFVQRQSLGAGDVLILAGLPPISNGLLPFAANQEFAASLVPAADTLAIDEYRHFFSDRTLSDLLSEPSFSLPLVALLAGMLLFFLWGYVEPEEWRYRIEAANIPPSFHEFTLSALRGLVGNSGGMEGAVALHAKLLARSHPNCSEALRLALGANSAPEKAARLVQLHRELLLKSRRLQSSTSQSRTQGNSIAQGNFIDRELA